MTERTEAEVFGVAPERQQVALGDATVTWLGGPENKYGPMHATDPGPVDCTDCGRAMPSIQSEFGWCHDVMPDGQCRECHERAAAARVAAAKQARRERAKAAGLAKAQALVAAFPARYRTARICDLSPELVHLIARWREGQSWLLLLTGETGAGKTHAAYAALCAWGRDHLTTLADEPWHAWYAPDLYLAAQRDGTSEDRERGGAVATLCKTRAAVLIDDLGQGKATEFTQQEIGRIVYSREANMLPTIITSNYSPTQLGEMFTDRVARRLSDGLWLAFDKPWRKQGSGDATADSGDGSEQRNERVRR